MRKLSYIYFIPLLIVLSIDLYGQTIRYVDGSLTGTGNRGTSWADAWESLSRINWNDLAGGGILYVSGGTDSLVYNESFPFMTGISGNAGNYIRIFAGKYSPSPSGHSGTVWIDGQDTRTNLLHMEGGGSCGGAGVKYVWVKGLSFRRAGVGGAAIYLHCDTDNIILDSLYIENCRLEGINIVGDDNYALPPNSNIAENITITECTIKSYTNNIGNEDNCIYAQMVAKLNINNTIAHQRNKQIGIVYPDHEHVDPLQTHVVRDVKLYNNVFVLDSSVMGHGMILGVQSRPGRLDTVIIYNNYIYADGHLNAGGNPYINGFVTRWYGYGASVYPPTYVIHNTVVTSNGGENTILQEYGIDVFVNNIVCQFGTNGQNPANYGGLGLAAFASSWNLDQTYVDSCRGNLMWNEWTNNMTFGGNQFVGSGGSPIGAPSNWTEWTEIWGGTGINENPLFKNNVKVGDVNRLDISENSPAIDAGVTEWWESWLQSKGLPTTDIHGNPRDWTKPDAGAMEYQTGAVDTVPSFSFTPLTNGELATEYIASSPFTDADSTFSVWTTTAAMFKINYDGTYSTANKTADITDTIFVKNVSSSYYSTKTTETIVAGGYSRDFDVTTKAKPSSEGIVRKVLINK